MKKTIDNDNNKTAFLPALFSSAGGKIVAVFAALFVFGVIILLFSGSGEQKQADGGDFCESEYISQLENKLESMISEIDGVGKVNVMLTLEGSAKSIFAKDVASSSAADESHSSRSDNSSVVFGSGSSSSREPVSIGEVYPTVRGVAVVCDGAVNSAVREKVISLVTCALNISTNRVCVTN